MVFGACFGAVVEQSCNDYVELNEKYELEKALNKEAVQYAHNVSGCFPMSSSCNTVQQHAPISNLLNVYFRISRSFHFSPLHLFSHALCGPDVIFIGSSAT